jgi:hypothetical protein
MTRYRADPHLTTPPGDEPESWWGVHRQTKPLLPRGVDANASCAGARCSRQRGRTASCASAYVTTPFSTTGRLHCDLSQATSSHTSARSRPPMRLAMDACAALDAVEEDDGGSTDGIVCGVSSSGGVGGTSSLLCSEFWFCYSPLSSREGGSWFIGRRRQRN